MKNFISEKLIINKENMFSIYRSVKRKLPVKSLKTNMKDRDEEKDGKTTK